MRSSLELSRRELEVANLVAEGLTNRQIADRLFIAERTAEGHVERIRNKLGFSTRSQIAAWVAAGGHSGRPQADGRRALPEIPGELIGREREVDELVEMVGRMRGVVTLTGPGGVGKTRLALEVAARLRSNLPDAVWFVDLSAVRDPDHVASTIARALGLRPQTDRPLINVIGAFLGDRRALLVMDNFEQVVAAAPVVTELLRLCPACAVLVTSREALRLYGEQEYPVPPLAVDGPGVSGPAGELFITRARSILPSLELGPSDRQAVNAICERLDGLPLAIELAAARIRVLSPTAMLERLGRSTDVLSSGARDLPARHRALTATFDWSYALLTEPERTLFRRLGVFSGGCTLEAAEAVCAGQGIEPSAVIDLIDALCSKSLLRSEESGAGARFRMLETLHDFARSKLEGSAEADRMGQAHMTYFRDLAEQVAPLVTSERELEAVSGLDSERPNFRAAIEWARHVDDPESELRLLGALYWYWLVRGEPHEGLGWLAKAPLGDERIPPETRAQAWWAAANLYLNAGIAAEAARAGRRLLELAPRCSHVARFMAAGYYAQALEAFDDRERVRELIEQSRHWAAQADDPFELGNTYTLLGEFEREYGSPEKAAQAYKTSLRLLQQTGELFQSAVNQNNLGQVGLLLGDVESAKAQFRKALPVARQFGAWKLLLMTLYGLAAVAGAEARYGVAARLLGCADAGLERAGYVLEHADRTPRDRLKADLRRRMGDSAFEESYADGRALDVLEVADLLAEGEV